MRRVTAIRTPTVKSMRTGGVAYLVTMKGMEHRTIRTKKLDNFRFKTYLKSNLEALYRNENGEIVWQDRMGTERTDAEQLAAK